MKSGPVSFISPHGVSFCPFFLPFSVSFSPSTAGFGFWVWTCSLCVKIEAGEEDEEEKDHEWTAYAAHVREGQFLLNHWGNFCSHFEANWGQPTWVEHVDLVLQYLRDPFQNDPLCYFSKPGNTLMTTLDSPSLWRHEGLFETVKAGFGESLTVAILPEATMAL